MPYRRHHSFHDDEGTPGFHWQDHQDYFDFSSFRPEILSARAPAPVVAAKAPPAPPTPAPITHYVSGDPGAFNIEINFKGTWTSDLQQAFINASEHMSDIITGDIANVLYQGKLIDDLRIDATLARIDGTGGILGQTGLNAVRSSTYLPVLSSMTFDSADAMALKNSGQWQDTITHEMIHALGFGQTVWNFKGLITGANGAAPLFTGHDATLTYQSLYHLAGAAGVPLEDGGGAGTKNSHWDEETFHNELMTGYLNAGSNPLSDITLAALEDMGYDTTWDASHYLIA